MWSSGSVLEWRGSYVLRVHHTGRRARNLCMMHHADPAAHPTALFDTFRGAHAPWTSRLSECTSLSLARAHTQRKTFQQRCVCVRARKRDMNRARQRVGPDFLAAPFDADQEPDEEEEKDEEEAEWRPVEVHTHTHSAVRVCARERDRET